MTILISTTDSLPGFNISPPHGLVHGDAIMGADFMRDFFARMRNFFGGRARSYENALAKARDQALILVERAALKAGANAVIGLRFDYEFITIRDGSMLVVIASGTAVTATPSGRPATQGTEQAAGMPIEDTTASMA